jgi:type I restriction enzyme S subunit
MIWQIAKLGDVCEVVMGQAPSGDTYNDQGNGYPLIAGAGDFKNGIINVGKYTTEPTKLSKSDDIVMSIRASIGDKVWVDADYCLGRGVAAIRANSKVDKKYLWHTLSHVESTLLSKGRGATFLQVNKDDIQTLDIPLPPLTEQKRIAEILDKATAIKAKRELAIAKLDELVQSTFVEMFGEVKTTNKWERRKISSVSNVYTGKTPPTSNKENYADEFPFVTPTDLKGLITSPARYVSKKGARLIKTVRKGSCLVGCIGDIGRVGYVYMPVTFNQQINAVEWNTDLVDDIFGYFSLKYMEEVLKASAVSAVVPILNKTNFSNISIPIPPISEQRKFSEFVCYIWKIENTMKNEVGKNLLASLQNQAFTTGFNA